MPARKKILERVVPGFEFFRQSKSEGEQFDEMEAFEIKIQYAEVLVSVWSHACAADGVFHKQEADIISKMIASLFEEGSLFYEYTKQRGAILEQLLETFESPLPLQAISEFSGEDIDFAKGLYEDAVCIVYADGILASEERNFLDNLAKGFQLSAADKKSIEKKYNLILQKR